jgi:hypothetical protein
VLDQFLESRLAADRRHMHDAVMQELQHSETRAEQPQ